ncbi:hypothetical protein [Rugosimonospora africana]|uniref:Uncharacterized protein n=1 Tax=Rugosimonospora africana TaxID=556532 RepID=A0A8J3VRL8_9ACTN|nr:hypothetical protein [Rugosimonospora africana]GIH15641.1 hypothetical protein Raf01_38130 [Rugosimonospora africana]
MAHDIHHASELLFTKLPREWSLAALGTGDHWTVTTPDGAELVTIGEPLLTNPLRRAWQAFTPVYPASDRFHCFEFRTGPESVLFELEKPPSTEKYAAVRRPGGEELGRLLFSPSRVEEKKVCLRMRDASGTSLGEALRVTDHRSPSDPLGYALYGDDGAPIATLTGVPHRVADFQGSYRLSIPAPLPEPLRTLVLATALACPYMRV